LQKSSMQVQEKYFLPVAEQKLITLQL
jgi:hypothetical protein